MRRSCVNLSKWQTPLRSTGPYYYASSLQRFPKTGVKLARLVSDTTANASRSLSTDISTAAAATTASSVLLPGNAASAASSILSHDNAINAKAAVAADAVASGPSMREIFTSATGALLTMTALSWPLYASVPGADSVFLLASFGSSACIMSVAPESPLSQPRNVILGHGVSATAGATAQALAAAAGFAPVYAVPIGVSLAVSLMMATRCIHPPAAGTAIIATLSPLSLAVLGPFVVLQGTLLVAATAAFSRIAGRSVYLKL